MDPTTNAALDTFVNITGASMTVAIQVLQENDGDINAAIDAYFNTREASIPSLPLENADRTYYIEEDNVPPRGPFEVPVQHVSSWNGDTPIHDVNLSLLTGRSPSQPSGIGITPQVSHPREVRNVPIDWHDNETNTFSRLRPFRQDFLQIAEVSADNAVHQESAAGGVVSMNDDAPSSTLPVSRLHGRHSERHPFGRSVYSGNRGASPLVPQVAEMSPSAYQDVNDVEEEMLRAAIEASKRDSEGAVTRRKEPFESGSRQVGILGTGVENDDLAQAVSLSLQTAEREKALRELKNFGASFNQAGNPLNEDLENLEERGGLASVDETKLAGKFVKDSASSSGIPEDVEEVTDEPLLRRRARNKGSSGVSQPRTSPIYFGDDLAVVGSQQGGLVQHGFEGPSQEQFQTLPQHSGGHLKFDEWGGISSEEHDEAVMLEAALFGGLPNSAILGVPYQQDNGHGEDFEYTEAFGPQRQHPQPPSPSVVAQRLLREQQDDEYLASLAMDREKDTKAMQEAEARRAKEQMAASAASAKEKLRLEEESIRLSAIEELARELNTKKANLPPEPAVDDENSLTLLVRLPDGSRHGRRFHKSDKLQSLFDFIDVSGGVDPGTYRLVRQYPRRTFQNNELLCSFNNVGLTSKQEVLFLEMI